MVLINEVIRGNISNFVIVFFDFVFNFVHLDGSVFDELFVAVNFHIISKNESRARFLGGNKI